LLCEADVNSLSRTLALVVAFGASGATLVACDDDGVHVEARDEGGIIAELQIEPGITLASATYSIVGPNAFSKTGPMDLRNSTAITSLISPLPAGTGFAIAVDATASDGATTCHGAAVFNVTATATTPVAIHVVCHEPTRNGGVLITGTLNVCPVIDILSASPRDMSLGVPETLTVSAHDPDTMPSSLSYSWSTSSGTLANAPSQTPTFTCTASGNATVTVVVTDGDATPGCAATATVIVSCH
jgi:hypothetical protein